MTSPIPPLLVVPWHDDHDDGGFDPRSEYAERFWLPVLGPTATFLMRRFAAEFDRRPDGFSLDVADTARSIGVGTRGGQNGPFFRSVARGIRFGLIHEQDHGIVAVRTRLPLVDRGQLGRLPRPIQELHDAWVVAAQRPAPPDHHAARLARSLLDVGATRDEVVDQLRRWEFDHGAACRALERADTAAASA